jgi:hypothetical protein
MWILRIKVFGVAGIVAIRRRVTGYWTRPAMRGLFVGTKTGNPLVDSVAERKDYRTRTD